ncbi:energy transducer TonB [Aurantiacibacter aquimixticola]|uniref:Energy transducer TonB n=1 Tax=Aurantiacibacter aquimixticola TaxID=1958945 RepID=A0A419RW20_9SPHN|nr:energy transducer TonB [Aurantiacibacter aquimixticola]RJY09978.1 energy transducer TonB [Aurantiacibacter aquimixticola]
MAALATLSTEERVGIGAAVIAHLALAAALAWHATRDMEPVAPVERVEVSLATEVSLESTAPDPSAEPAASFAPVVTDLPSPPEQNIVSPPVQPRVERPVEPRPDPRPTARSTARPTPAPSPSSRASARPTPAPSPTASRRAGGSRLGSDFLDGSSTADGNRGQPAATFGASERAALNSAVTRQLRPHWSAPSGVDVDLLVTVVSWRLNRDGSLSGSPRCVTQSGINDSNRPQADLHCERARRAVQLAAPFNLPEQFYSRWDDLQWTFDRRL